MDDQIKSKLKELRLTILGMENTMITKNVSIEHFKSIYAKGQDIFIPKFIMEVVGLSLNHFTVWKTTYPDKHFDFTVYGLCAVGTVEAAKYITNADLRKFNTSWDDVEVIAIIEMIDKFGNPRNYVSSDLFSNAQIYCISSAQSVNEMRAKHPEFQKGLDKDIEKMKKDIALQNLTFNQLVDLVIKQTKKAIQLSGGKLDDEETVAWNMGILCYMYRNSCTMLDNKYDEIFIASWNKYFSS